MLHLAPHVVNKAAYKVCQYFDRIQGTCGFERERLVSNWRGIAGEWRAGKVGGWAKKKE